MKSFPLLVSATMLVASIPHAQERTAGSALDTQMTWSALSNQIGVVKNQLLGLDSKVIKLDDRVDKLELCGTRGRIFAPGTVGADTEGCLAVGGMRWIEEGRFYLTFDSVEAPLFRYQAALKAIKVTRPCNAPTGAYSQGDKYVSSYKVASFTSTNEVVGHACSKRNDRCYQTVGRADAPNAVSVLLCN